MTAKIILPYNKLTTAAMIRYVAINVITLVTSKTASTKPTKKQPTTKPYQI